MNESTALAIELIKKHEGLKLKPYRCTAGKLTIGYGRNLDDIGIYQDEADYLLFSDLNLCVEDLKNFSFWPDLIDTRKAVLIDMRYNLGPSRFRQFKKMLDAIIKEDYARAAREMLHSNWANQVHGRAITLAGIMRTGKA